MPKKSKMKAGGDFRLMILPMMEYIVMPFEKKMFITGDPVTVDLITKANEAGGSMVGVLYAGALFLESEERIGALCLLDKNSIEFVEGEDGPVVHFSITGISRFRIIKVLKYTEAANIKYPSEAEIEVIKEENISLSSLDTDLIKRYKTAVNKFNSIYGISLPAFEESCGLNVGQLADKIVGFFEQMPLLVKLLFLENFDPLDRFKEVLEMLERFTKGAVRIPVKHQSSGGEDKDLDDFEKRFDKIKHKLSDAGQRYVLRELEKFAKLHPTSSDYYVSENWLRHVFSLFELEPTEECLDMRQIIQKLDEDHYGLKDIKERFLEDVGVRILNPGLKGSILCFVGPPGVGKTSLGKSIAAALGRKFIRWSAGGVSDEAEIRGHRRTYVGAKSGRIIEALINSGSSNPLFMIDEVDKLGKDFKGDPSSALLEALDPEQNYSFSDHFIEIPFNLSGVLFIVTGNTIEPIPPALRDRLEILRLPGYAEEEKIGIARNFLIPKQLSEKGLIEKLSVKFEDEALCRIIREYTEEAGVRNLEREIAKIFRKLARKVAEGKLKEKSYEISEANIPEFLGAPKFIWDEISKNHKVGSCNGLAWTDHGGEVLPIQFKKIKGSGQIILTGSLGEVMKESAIVARSLLRSRIHTEKEAKLRDDFHFHAPEGATPKEGPSAGAAFFLAAYSGVKNTPVKEFLAVTGEIDLEGNILPVGGIQEKITGGTRKGIKEIILPSANKSDIDNLPSELEIKKMILSGKIIIHYVKTIDEALDIAFPERKAAQNEPEVPKLKN